MANDGRESVITTLPKKVPIDWFTPRKWNAEMSTLQKFHVQNHGIMIALPSAELCRPRTAGPNGLDFLSTSSWIDTGYAELAKYTLLTKKEMDSMRILVDNGYASVDSDEDGNDDGDYIDVEYEDDDDNNNNNNNNNNNFGGGGGGGDNDNDGGGGKGKGKVIARTKVKVKAIVSRDGKAAKSIAERSKTAGPSKEKKTQVAGPSKEKKTQTSERAKGKRKAPTPIVPHRSEDEIEDLLREYSRRPSTQRPWINRPRAQFQ